MHFGTRGQPTLEHPSLHKPGICNYFHDCSAEHANLLLLTRLKYAMTASHIADGIHMYYFAFNFDFHLGQIQVRHDHFQDTSRSGLAMKQFGQNSPEPLARCRMASGSNAFASAS